MRSPSRTAMIFSVEVPACSPSERIHVDTGGHLTPCLIGIAHDLRRLIKAHRLRIENRGAEHIRMMAFHPAEA